MSESLLRHKRAMSRESVVNLIKQARVNGNLDLGDCGLEELPAEVGSLTNLISLNLNGNRLKKLPPEIGNLTRLRDLNLNNNFLSELPAEIGLMTRLQTIRLRANHLTELPGEMRLLQALQILELQGNPLPISHQVLENEPRQVIAQILANQEKHRINEVKLMVLGSSGSGKTAIIRRLVERSWLDQPQSTRGCEIYRWPVRIDQKRIRINIWDFGREETQNRLHRMFVSPRSLYLIVLDPSEKENRTDLENWLKVIREYSNGSKVIVVLNKSDRGSIEIDRRAMQVKYPGIALFLNTSARQDLGMMELRDGIKQLVGEMDNLQSRWKPGWLNVKSRIEILEKRYISYADFQRICVEERVSAKYIPEIVDWMHDLGNVLYFRDDIRVANIMVKDPTWLIEAINSLMIKISGMTGRSVLTAEEISEHWSKAGYELSQHLFLLNMMVKFRICFPILSSPDPVYLFPARLSHEEPYSGWESESALTFRYQYSAMPPNLMSDLASRLYHLVYKQNIWNNGVLLSDGHNKALVRTDEGDNQISIWVFGRAVTRRDFLAKIRLAFEKIHKSFPFIRVHEKVPVPQFPAIAIDYQHLLLLAERKVGTFIPEGMDKQVSVDDLLNGESGPPRFTRERLNTLQKELVLVNARIERQWLHLANPEKQAEAQVLEEKVRESEGRRIQLLTEIEAVKLGLQEDGNL